MTLSFGTCCRRACICDKLWPSLLHDLWHILPIFGKMLAMAMSPTREPVRVTSPEQSQPELGWTDGGAALAHRQQKGGCGALLWLAICFPTSLSIWYVVVGRHHPRLWRNTLCVVLSQLSAVLTNFQSIILMPGGVNGFVLGRKTFSPWFFSLITRMCLFYFNFDRNQVMSHLWEGTVSGTSVPYFPLPPLFSLSNGENRATTW